MIPANLCDFDALADGAVDNDRSLGLRLRVDRHHCARRLQQRDKHSLSIRAADFRSDAIAA
jgi:hypothetical protein